MRASSTEHYGARQEAGSYCDEPLTSISVRPSICDVSSELEGVVKDQAIFIGTVGIGGKVRGVAPLCRYVLERAALYGVGGVGNALPFLAIFRREAVCEVFKRVGSTSSPLTYFKPRVRPDRPAAAKSKS
ncbi:hypothetical protein D3C75_785430 [compost metagenome]